MMPSKTKKNSKTTSRLSSSGPSPRTPSLGSSLDSELSEQQVMTSYLEAASSRYPSFIGQSAFIGRISDVDNTTGRGCTIWLSESSMVSSSLTPGSVVSVSLAALDRRFSSSNFPLSSFSCEWSRQCEVESVDERANAAGDYFALARVFPSCKVSKDGVQLSSNLAYTMGCPASGRVVFVYSIQNKLLNDIVNENDKPQGGVTDSLLVHNCNKLYLELVPFTNKVKMKSDTMSVMELSAEKRYDHSENGMISSPKTPLCQQKLSTPSPVKLALPVREEAGSSLSTPQSNLSNLNGEYIDSLDVKEVLEDESAKKLLQST